MDANQNLLLSLTDEGLQPSSLDAAPVLWPHQLQCFERPSSSPSSALPSAVLYLTEYLGESYSMIACFVRLLRRVYRNISYLTQEVIPALPCPGRVWRLSLERDTSTGQFNLKYAQYTYYYDCQ